MASCAHLHSPTYRLSCSWPARRLNEHAVVRIAVDGSPRVDAIRLAPRALLLPPAVDSEGYTFVLEKKNHMPVVQRVKDLNAKPGRWLDLGGCL